MRNKIFCIGWNKTGTTSLAKTFSEMGYKVGVQHKAEILIDDYFSGNYESIIDYCKSADFFQDIPFSNTNIYEILENVYPQAKFILSIRNNSETWYNSLVKFHDNGFYHGKNRVPNL